VNGYDAYFGTYRLDESTGTLRTALEGVISPGNVGAVFERRLDLADGKLRIRLTTTAADGSTVHRMLTFVRAG
jgi:hypothetical protein